MKWTQSHSRNAVAAMAGRILMKPNPVRLVLSRKRGFNLQVASLALNGLPAVNCARPSKWGNPYQVNKSTSQSEAVRLFKARIDANVWSEPNKKQIIAELRGKNLACWCKKEPCHASILLEIANA